MADATPADLHGRIALVTGASSGLGLETARELARRGARVLLACRDRQRAETAREQLAATARGPLEILSLDLADLAGVAAAEGTARLAASVVSVACAGVSPPGCADPWPATAGTAAAAWRKLFANSASSASDTGTSNRLPNCASLPLTVTTA